MSLTDTVRILIEQLADDTTDTTTRLVLADALDESERPEEAALLRDESVRVMLVDDVVCDAGRRTYTYHEAGGHSESLDAEDMDEACELAEDLCRDGDWGDGSVEGCTISVRVTEADAAGEETGYRNLEVDIEPDHDALISRAGGDTDCDHVWTSVGEGGCRENPGVWSGGGTTFYYAAHCRACGLRRRETAYGCQRNPGQSDTVSYEQPADWCVECQSADCGCERADDAE